MFDYLEMIRKKSEATRRKVAITVSSVVVVLIFGVWAATYAARFSDPFSQVGAALNSDQTASTTSPFDELQQNITQGFQSFQQSISGNSDASDNSDNSVQVQDASSSDANASSTYVTYPDDDTGTSTSAVTSQSSSDTSASSAQAPASSTPNSADTSSGDTTDTSVPGNVVITDPGQ